MNNYPNIPSTNPPTRRGKIARLPRAIRETLNRRLSDGEMAHSLLIWLNAQPEVQSILTQQFEGRPITEQNLSEWRHSGYLDWQQTEFFRESLTGLAEELQSLGLGPDQEPIADRAAALQSLALVRLLLAACAEPVSDRREQRILTLVRSLNTVRRCDHDLERVQLQRQRQQHAHAAKAPLDEAQVRERARLQTLERKLFWESHDQLSAERAATRERNLRHPLPPSVSAPASPSTTPSGFAPVHPVPGKPAKPKSPVPGATDIPAGAKPENPSPRRQISTKIPSTPLPPQARSNPIQLNPASATTTPSTPGGHPTEPPLPSANESRGGPKSESVSRAEAPPPPQGAYREPVPNKVPHHSYSYVLSLP
jgi:hypothetical protein